MPAPPAARASRPHRRACSAGATLSSVGSQDLERERLHRVAGEHRLGDAEAHVHGRLAAAQDVVVHARQVVVDERVGVDQLDRAGGAQRGRARAVHRVGGGEDEQRAQALAAVEDGIAHGLAEAGRRVGGNAGVERRLDRVELGQRPGVEASSRFIVPTGGPAAPAGACSWPSSSTFTCCSTASRRERQYWSSSVPRR